MRPSSSLLVLVSVCVLNSCGGGGGNPPGPPFLGGNMTIAAELDSFAPGSSPPGLPNATVQVLGPCDCSNGGPSLTDASVTINNTALAYNPASGQYEGYVQVAPGGSVRLNVSYRGYSYGLTGSQFTSYPAISAPAPNTTIDTGDTTTVVWSAGAPTADASYALGIRDADNPASGLVWPLDHNALVEPTTSSSFTIPPGSITGGKRLVLAGIFQKFSNLAAGAAVSLVIGGYSYIPITVTGMPVTARVSGTTNALRGVVWSGSQFVAVGEGATILTSADGATWIKRDSGATTGPTFLAVVWSGTEYVLGGFSILTSPDEVVWTLRSSLHAFGIAWSGSNFVAVGDAGSIATSPDGIAWTQRVSGTQDDLHGVTWSGSQFVAVGVAGAILTSPDGVTWTSRGNGGGLNLSGVTWSGTQFVAVGDVILTSPDGIVWTPQTSNASSLGSVVWSGSQYLAVGSSGVNAAGMQSSPDGVNWKAEAAAGSQYPLYGVAWSGTSFVAVGANGTILTSP